MTASDFMTAAHAVTRAARLSDPSLASERYSTTLGREMRRMRAALDAAASTLRPASFARSAKGAGPAAWVSGARPRVGERLQVTRRDGRASRFYVHGIERVSERGGRNLWRVRVAKAIPAR